MSDEPMESIIEADPFEREIHPIDVEALEKGGVIAAEEIESITGQKRGTQRYQLAALGLREFIEKRSLEMGNPLLLRSEGDNLRVMTDAEAIHQLDSRARAGIRMLGRAAHNYGSIDVRNLTEAEMAQLNRRQTIHAATFAAAVSARRKTIRAVPYQRQTPGLLGADEVLPEA